MINLQDFKDAVKEAAYPGSSEVPKTHCIDCRQFSYDPEKGYNPTRFFTVAGVREFHISQLCEVCFAKIFADEE